MRRTRRKRTGFDKKIAQVKKEICRLAEHRRGLESAAWGAARKKERGDFIFFLVGLERTHRKLAMLEAELHSLEVRREKERALEERKVSGAASPKGVSNEPDYSPPFETRPQPKKEFQKIHGRWIKRMGCRKRPAEYRCGSCCYCIPLAGGLGQNWGPAPTRNPAGTGAWFLSTSRADTTERQNSNRR